MGQYLIGQSRSYEKLETMILRQLSLELSGIFPEWRVAPLPLLRGETDGQVDAYGLTSAQEALRLYMAIVADLYVFSNRTGGVFIPEPLYGLAKGGWGVKIEDLFCVGPFHIGIAWLDGETGSSFQKKMHRFLECMGRMPCTR